VSVYDDFNRTSPTSLGVPSGGPAAWQDLIGSWYIDGNRAASSATVHAITMLPTTFSDVQVEAGLPVIGTDAGLIARVTDAGNHILAAIRIFGVQLYQWVGGDVFELASLVSVTPATTDVWRLEVIGAGPARLYRKPLGGSFTLLTEAALLAPATGTGHGLRAFNDSVVRFDNFVATDMGTPAVPASPASLLIW
jgi:hypothetical protein